MPLNLDSLTLWEISHRWYNHDPSVWRPRLPLEVRDITRVMLSAILDRSLVSLLSLDKGQIAQEDFPKEFSVYTWLDDIYSAIAGNPVNRKMLRIIQIDRWDLADWCEREGIPKPQFWFPSDWKPRLDDQDVEEVSEGANDDEEPNHTEGPLKLRPSTRAKIACQEVAKNLWKQKEHVDTTITSMAVHEVIHELCGGQHYSKDRVRKWIKDVAPAHISNRRGRPPKLKLEENSTEPEE